MPELEQQIASDLKYLHSTWNLPDVDDDFLRRDSAILRRLLIDGGAGVLRTYRKQAGHKGDVKVEAVDLKAQLEGISRDAIRFASAGGATFQGTTVWGAAEYNVNLTPEQVAQRHKRGVITKTMGLSRYLDSTCLVVGGTSVSRRNLIQYMANRFGGVHYDDSREHSNEATATQFKALDVAMEEYVIANKRAVFFELLAIGQTLVKSPDLKNLMER